MAVRRCLLLASWFLVGCHSVAPHLDRWSEVTVNRCAVIVPQDRVDSPSLQRWVASRQRQGLEVTLVPFDQEAELAVRSARIREGLRAAQPPAGEHSYALILADGDALPMGPWLVDGLDRTVDSDLPWFLESAPEPEKTWLGEDTWQQALDEDFAWVASRIPSTDEAVWARALSAERPEPTGPGQAPLALLGCERYFVWGDTAWIMARARSVLQCRGWRALTISEDWPGDVRLGSLDAEDRIRADGRLGEVCRQCGVGPVDGCDFTTDCLTEAWHPERLLFLASWMHLSPEVVYLNSHGSGMFGTTVGDWLLSEQRVEQLELAMQAQGLPLRPERPALLIVGACRAGSAHDTLIPRLLRDGWAHGVIASTENTDPRPLGAALQSEVDVVRSLRPGLTTGLALRACLESYLCDARGSLSWWLRGSTPPLAARNVLGITLFGDPTRPVPAAPAYNRRP